MRMLPVFGAVTAVAILASGCGYSEDQWQAQLAKYNQLKADDDAKEAQIKDAQAKIDDLTKQLKDLGIEVSSTKASLADRQKALEEYQARAKQLEAIKE